MAAARRPSGARLERRSTAGRRRAALGAAWLLTAALTLSVPVVPAAATAQGGPAATHVVRADAGAMGRVLDHVRAVGGSVDRTLPALDTVVAELSPGQVADLADEPGVTSVTPDAGLRLTSTTYDAKADVDSMHNIATVVGARDTWSRFTGRGIDIGIIDSGVNAVAGLEGPGKVIRGTDLSFDSQHPALRHLDTFVHGTHMAGIMAGRDRSAEPAKTVADDATSYLGVAPDARVVSLKVADAYGSTDVSQVLAAIDWTVQHGRQNGMNVRVLNLSFSVPPRQAYEVDPLSHAVEVAWRNGIVVVTSAGNDGTAAGTLGNPAYNPRILAVGAVESNGTRDTADDVIPSWSSRGTAARSPDIVAPGAHVQGLRVAGSLIDHQHGAGPGSINARFLRGSGTSQAAAVVSGAAAVLLEQRPSLTPDQVKALLTSTARKLPAADPQASGKGLIDLKRAIQTATPTVTQDAVRSTGTGSLELARGGRALVRNDVALTGERDIFGKPYDAAAQAAARTSLSSWSGGAWNGSTWTGVSWDGVSWDGVSWDGVSWNGVSWNGVSWNGVSWDGVSWNGVSWDGVSWDGVSWNGVSWNSQAWATAGWR